MKIESSRNGAIALSLTDIGKPCPSHEFLTSQICLLTLFVKIKFSLKFPDLQYHEEKKKEVGNARGWVERK